MLLSFAYAHSPDATFTETIDDGADFDVDDLKSKILKTRVEEDAGKDAIVFIKKLYSWPRSVANS
jgi:hypothetical protein